MAVSLLDAIKGITYPEQQIVIYPDFEAMNRLGELEEQAAALSGDDSDLNNELLEEQKALLEQINETRWVFTLRGLPRSVVAVISKKHERNKDVSERMEKTNEELVLRSVVKVVNAADEEMEFDEDSLKEFFEAVPSDVYLKFLGAVNELSANSLKYEYKVLDPNFS